MSVVDKEFGSWLHAAGWIKIPSQSSFSGIGSWVVLKLGSIRLRLMSDRGSPLWVEVAPVEPTTGWFDGEWHHLPAVLEWLQTGIARGKTLPHAPSVEEVASRVAEVDDFCSPAGAADRERFVEHMTWPPT